jgi:hypothetical protein
LCFFSMVHLPNREFRPNGIRTSSLVLLAGEIK